MTDRDGRRTSSVLTEARTILSRAETARTRILNGTEWTSGVGFTPIQDDPAAPEILAALEAVVAVLHPFRRVGR